MSIADSTRLTDIKAIFSPQGRLAQHLPGYQVRQEQIELSEIIQEALETGSHCLAEAGTGVGKSLAYLVPGIAWALRTNNRLLVSTYTKALQLQLIHNELPRLAANSPFAGSFRFELCMGAENYICLLRLLREEDQEILPGFDPEYVKKLKQCMLWCKGEVTGLRQDLPVSVSDILWKRICIVSDLCPGKQCPFFTKCFLQKARQRQREADILVANHHLFFSDLLTEGRILPAYRAVIVDEAHQLEDVATGFLGETLSQFEVLQILSELSRGGKGHFIDSLSIEDKTLCETIREQAITISTLQEYWWQQLLVLFPHQEDTFRVLANEKPVPPPDTELIVTLAGKFMELQEIADTEERARVLAYFATRLLKVARIEQEWYEHASCKNVYWAEKYKIRRSSSPPQDTPGLPGEISTSSGKGEALCVGDVACRKAGRRKLKGGTAGYARGASYIRLHITPLDLSQSLAQLVFGNTSCVVLTSATMSVGRDFTYIRSRLGIPRALEIVANSPFPYSENAALYLPHNIPDPRETEDFETYVMQAAAELIDLFQGGVFILCTSYRMLKRTAKYLREKYSQRVFLVQGEAPPQRLINFFQESNNAVLLGVETFWQGVDVPGDALRCVVITRLPFDVPTHPVHQARAEYLSRQGENPFLTYSLPRAALMLRQGFGRLIRRHEDKGVVAILDPRLLTRAWGRIFLNTLPECPCFTLAEQVREFIENRFNFEKTVA